jgi:hypothetical protein
MPSIITENTDPTPPKDPKPYRSYPHSARRITSNKTNSQIKPNSSPIVNHKRSHLINPFSGGKKSRKRRIRKSKKSGYRKQNKKTFRFF